MRSEHSECHAHLQGFWLCCISFLIVWLFLLNFAYATPISEHDRINFRLKSISSLIQSVTNRRQIYVFYAFKCTVMHAYKTQLRKGLCIWKPARHIIWWTQLCGPLKMSSWLTVWNPMSWSIEKSEPCPLKWFLWH